MTREECVQGLLVHPPEATNALTFINSHYCRCVCESETVFS